MSLDLKLSTLLEDLEARRKEKAIATADAVHAMAKGGSAEAVRIIRETKGNDDGSRAKLDAEIALEKPSQEFLDAIDAETPHEKGDDLKEKDVQIIKSRAMSLLASELSEDPAGRGYVGKTAEEIATLLNDPYSGPREDLPEVNEFKQARISVIWAGVPHVPNAVDVDDVVEAGGA